MDLLKMIYFLFFLPIGIIPTVTSECSKPFINGDEESFCYYMERTSVSWSGGLNQCLNEAIDGVLIEIKTKEQFHSLQTIDIYGKKTFWLGANNFASFADSKWHWIDGSIVDSSVVTWCSNSTYDVAIGTQCAAYDPNLQCLTNYLCSTALQAPCVSKNLVQQSRMNLASRALTSALCTNSYGGAYANWWTYSIILINWFILFCFNLYLTNRLNLNKRLVILSVTIVLTSFMMIIAFAILWGVQYQDLQLLPLIVVIVGCIGCLLFIIGVFILILQRTQIQRSMLCAIVTGVAFIIELGLMIGIILCIAHCSGYITFGDTRVEKDIIAALLASITTAISIIFYNLILFLIGHVTRDRIHTMQPNNQFQASSIPLTTAQPIAPRRSNNNNNDGNATNRISSRMERATSPVDQRILNEFYGDRPKDVHQYELGGRKYVVYEGKTFSDIDPYRKDLTEAMLLQESQGLREAIARARNSPHASSLTQEIQQAEELLNRLS